MSLGLHEKTSQATGEAFSHHREHSALQNNIFLNFFFFLGVFANLNPDLADPKKSIRIRIHNTAKQAWHLPGYNSVFVGCAIWIPYSAENIEKREFAYNPVYGTDKNHPWATKGTHFYVTERILKMLSAPILIPPWPYGTCLPRAL